MTHRFLWRNFVSCCCAIYTFSVYWITSASVMQNEKSKKQMNCTVHTFIKSSFFRCLTESNSTRSVCILTLVLSIVFCWFSSISFLSFYPQTNLSCLCSSFICVRGVIHTQKATDIFMFCTDEEKKAHTFGRACEIATIWITQDTSVSIRLKSVYRIWQIWNMRCVLSVRECVSIWL